MRRDYFTLGVDGVGGPEPQQPVVTVAYEGPTEQLETRLSRGGRFLEADEIDIAFRLKGEGDGEGVLAVADRMTGEYVLELNADADAVFSVVEAAREFGQAGDAENRYQLRIRADGEVLATYEKSTLLVYDADGELLRGRSLIPSGVEL